MDRAATRRVDEVTRHLTGGGGDGESLESAGETPVGSVSHQSPRWLSGASSLGQTHPATTALRGSPSWLSWTTRVPG